MSLLYKHQELVDNSPAFILLPISYPIRLQRIHTLDKKGNIQKSLLQSELYEYPFIHKAPHKFGCPK